MQMCRVFYVSAGHIERMSVAQRQVPRLAPSFFCIFFYNSVVFVVVSLRLFFF